MTSIKPQNCIHFWGSFYKFSYKTLKKNKYQKKILYDITHKPWALKWLPTLCSTFIKHKAKAFNKDPFGV